MKERVAVNIVKKGDEVLVVERFKNDGVTKSFPSGKIENNEEIHEAALRETAEETTVKTAFKKLIGSRIHPDTQKELFYCLSTYISGEPQCEQDTNITRAGRIHKDKLEEYFTTNIYPPVLETLYEGEEPN